MRTRTIVVKGKPITVHIDGDGVIPCMFVGAAKLFIKPGMLSETLRKTFTLYFVDLWERHGAPAAVADEENYDDLDWNTVVDEIEEAKTGLGLEKVVLMGHSAAGAIPIEYARKYPDHCLLAVPVAFSPLWTEELQTSRNDFISLHASGKRQTLMADLDTEYRARLPFMDPETAFVEKFKTDRPVYWKDYETAEAQISYMWQDYHPNVTKAITYFTRILSGYNFFAQPLENVPVLWCLGLYDYSVPVTLLTDRLNELTKQGKLTNVGYYLFTAGHYPMTEVSEEFAQVLQAKVQELGLACLYSTE